MYDKRGTFVLAGLAACAVLAGCATKTEGAATFAGPSVSSPSKVPSSPSSAMPSGSPTPSSSPSASDEPSDVPSSEVPSSQAPMSEGAPTSRSSGKVDLSEDGAICELISPTQLKTIWHQTPRTFPDSASPGCTYKDADGNQIILSEYDNLVPSEMAKEDKLDDQKEVKTTVAGHPALVTLSSDSFGQGDWYVSEGKNLDAEGVVGAILSSDPTLQKEAKAMLALIVPKYAH